MKTKVMKIFAGQTSCIVGNARVANGKMGKIRVGDIYRRVR